jgi:hypothetical protein
MAWDLALFSSPFFSKGSVSDRRRFPFRVAPCEVGSSLFQIAAGYSQLHQSMALTRIFQSRMVVCGRDLTTRHWHGDSS